MAKVHKSCDICPGETPPVVLSLGEQARRLVRGTLHPGLSASSASSAREPGTVPNAWRTSSADMAQPTATASGSLLQAYPAGVAAAITPEHIRLAGEQLLAQASAEGARIIREARQQAVEIEQEAYVMGYEAGCRQASLEQDAHRLQMAEQMQSMVDDIERRNRQQMEQLEPEVLELSLQVAEKVIGHELSRSDEAFRSLVRAALTRLKQSERICVRVSAQDAGWLTEGVAAGLPMADTLQVKGERQLPAGSCLIETDSGLVDASVPVQLRRIRETLQEPGV